MQKLHFLKLVMALVLFVLPSTAHANLLANSGFETWITISPQGEEAPKDWWHRFGYDPDITGTKESAVVLDGSYSGKMQMTGYGWGGWQQRQPFMAGNTLYVHQPVYVPNDMVAAHVTLEIIFESSPQVPVGYPVFASREMATSGWDAIQFNAVAPVTTNYFNYEIRLEALDVYYTPFSGVAYVDNAYADTVPISHTPEPTSIMLFGSGLIWMLVAKRLKKRKISR